MGSPRRVPKSAFGGLILCRFAARYSPPGRRFARHRRGDPTRLLPAVQSALAAGFGALELESEDLESDEDLELSDPSLEELDSELPLAPVFFFA